jgi:membrane protease YdiL (CAAX protease family)
VPPYSNAAGLRLLLVFVVLEWIIGPRLSLFTFLGLPVPPSWLRIPIMLGVALLAVRFIAGLKFSAIGLHRWRWWSRTEKSYFLQMLVIANIIFSVIVSARLRAIILGPSALAHVFGVFLPYLLWGIYQEVLYRGMLQTELVRRLGALPGLLISNTLFTFGPLHFYHFAEGRSSIPTFAAIFAIGLFFGVLFLRSGNLWLAAVFHGIGNMYLDGTH